MGTQQRRSRVPTPTPNPLRVAGQRDQAAISGAAQGRVAAPRKAPEPAAPQGLYPELGVVDETAAFGALGYGSRGDDMAEGIIQHRTEGSTMDSTRSVYRDRVKKGGHVGAHYLVGTGGEISLTVPTDKHVGHLRGNKDKAYKGANTTHIGIENVGMASRLNPKGDLRAQVQALDLPPRMKASLLAMDDKALKRHLADSEYHLHTDISGPQKRANWNLVNRLGQDHGFGLDEVRAHEHVDYKTHGEGEPIIEFLAARQRYPALVEALRAKVTRLAADPQHDPAELTRLQGLLASEDATARALAVDGTMAERNAVEGEALIEQDGPATQREGLRTGFYERFWARFQALEAAAR